MKKVVVVNSPSQWDLDIPDLEVITPAKYLKNDCYADVKNLRVFNLCQDYAYQTKGYYVSLLAEARGHKVIPSVKHLLDLKVQPVVKVVSEELDDVIQRSLKRIKSDEFILSVYFGKNLASQYNTLAHEFHKLFQAPLLRIRFVHANGKWEVNSIKAIPFKEIPMHHMSYVFEFAKEYFTRKRYDEVKRGKYIYDLAILIDHNEAEPPSNKKALQKFASVAEKMGCYVEFITKNDYGRVREFDMLFIRTTTGVNHYTYRFARRAQSEGLAVIDSPESILKCANKVYLAELLKAAKVPTPKSIIVSSVKDEKIPDYIGFPCVLKLPDSSFSMGVKKAKNPEELKEKLGAMLKQSDLVVVQEFVPTDFDWRVGVLNNEVLFVCKYFMAKGHWQIYNWGTKQKEDVCGEFENVPIDQVPDCVIKTALKATKLIGDGLYGVDIKEIDGKAIVIEINDNPNIDAGIEDQLAEDTIYKKLITHLIHSVDLKHI